MGPDRFGKYRVLRKIASGGMAEVYLCRMTGEEGFRKRVALKVIHPRHAEDSRFRDLFVREARLAASLSHQNVVQVFDFGREGSDLFLAMEYVEGWNLAQAAMQARQQGAPIPPGVWRIWVEGMWAGLSYLHGKDVVHGDLSPGNILLGRSGSVKLTDFGVSRAMGEDGGATGLRAGKSGYLSPERARGEEATDSSDRFAAGVISVELLLGRRLFDADGPKEALDRVLRFDERSLEMPGVSPGAADMLRRAVARTPEDRYPSAGRFLEDLAKVGPPRAAAPALEDFWDVLFPPSAEEETAGFPAENPGPPGGMVQERREWYGMRARKVRAGAAAAFAAMTIGGIFLWREVRQHTGAEPQAPPAPGLSLSPKDPVPHDLRGDGNAVPAAPGKAEADTPAVERAHPEPSPSVPRFGNPVLPASAASERRSPASDFVRAAVPAVEAMPQAQPRTVRIETDPPGATVLSESGATLGKTPLSIDPASLGGKGIVLEGDGYERMAIPGGALFRESTLRTELEPVVGTVEAIQAIPWAKVYLGEKYLGETPLRSVRLPVGERRLRFVNEPLGVDKTEKLVVRPGGNPKVIVPMTETGLR